MGFTQRSPTPFFEKYRISDTPVERSLTPPGIVRKKIFLHRQLLGVRERLVNS